MSGRCSSRALSWASSVTSAAKAGSSPHPLRRALKARPFKTPLPRTYAVGLHLNPHPCGEVALSVDMEFLLRACRAGGSATPGIDRDCKLKHFPLVVRDKPITARVYVLELEGSFFASYRLEKRM